MPVEAYQQTVEANYKNEAFDVLENVMNVLVSKEVPPEKIGETVNTVVKNHIEEKNTGCCSPPETPALDSAGIEIAKQVLDGGNSDQWTGFYTGPLGDTPPYQWNWTPGQYTATTSAATSAMANLTYGNWADAIGTGITGGITGATTGAITYGTGSNYQYHLQTIAGVEGEAATYNIFANGQAVNSPYATFTVDVGGNLTVMHPPLSKEEQVKQRLKNAIKRRLSPEERRTREFLAALRTPQEQKARDTLRDMISEADWRRYVTNAFLMVRGPSNKWYQIFANGSRPNVYERGQKVATLCIHTSSECPPSDHVINLKLLIELDEAALWKGSNVTWHIKPPELKTDPHPYGEGAAVLNELLGQADLNQIQVGGFVTNGQIVNNILAGNVTYGDAASAALSYYGAVDDEKSSLVDILKAAKTA